MNRRAIAILGMFLILLLAVVFIVSFKKEEHYLAVGTGGKKGEVIVYSLESEGKYSQIKQIDTGYNFVHTVRIGKIFNDKKNFLIAGVSNSFYGDYGCRVIGYNLQTFEKITIDKIRDLRCKDLTIGDADNDGENEIVLGTHGEGYIRLYDWNGKSWVKTDLDHNFVGKMDKKIGVSHQVPQDQLPCLDCTLNTAVHIVKIADINNDGKNEVIASLSSPLELKDVEEVSYLKVFALENGKWKESVVDQLKEREFRSIEVGDFYHTNKNVLIVGIGSPRNEKGSVYSYALKNGKWEKNIIYNDKDEKNMKGIAFGDIYHDGIKRLLLATGFPKAKVMILEEKDGKVKSESLGTIASLFPKAEGQFNSMISLIQNTNTNPTVIVGGTQTFPQKKIGWEATNDGFLTIFHKDNRTWKSEMLTTKNILSMDQY